MTTIASRKAKGRRLQQLVRDHLVTALNGRVTLDDIRSTSMGASGLDILLSSKAQSFIPFDIECKNKESLKGLYNEFDQAESNTNFGRIPLLVMKSNGREPLAILNFIDLMVLLEKIIDNTPSNS